MLVRRLDLCGIALLVLADCHATGPVEEVACTDVGCSDGIVLTLNTPDNTWPDGHYEFVISLDGDEHLCTLELPSAIPNVPGSFVLPCNTKIGATLTPKLICADERTGASVSHTCTPIQHQWTLEVSQSGTPTAVSVRVTRDGTTILDANPEPQYEELHPNGPRCEPVCQRAQLDLTLE